MYQVLNQTTQPQELSNGIHLAAGASVPLSQIGAREICLARGGFVTIHEREAVANSEDSPRPPAPEVNTRRRSR